MHHRSISFLIFLTIPHFIASQKQIPFLFDQFHDSLTAYGPGLAVFSPYSYVDLFYDNIPFVGKIGTLGKEGTSSHTGISPFYPATGNPSVAFPPLYKARPIPPHVPEPAEIVPVPLDEQTLQGEPLFPKELTLPWLTEKAIPDADQSDGKPVKNPFDDLPDKTSIKSSFEAKDDLDESEEVEPEDLVRWPNSKEKHEKFEIIGEKIIKLPKPENKKSKFGVLKRYLLT